LQQSSFNAFASDNEGVSFDPMIASPCRLRILTALAQESRQPFVQLRRATGLTDGNLATHARRLQSAGFIAIEKSITAGKPLTTLHLTTHGRDALAAHARTLLTALNARTLAPVAVAPAVGDYDDDWVD